MIAAGLLVLYGPSICSRRHAGRTISIPPAHIKAAIETNMAKTYCNQVIHATCNATHQES